MKGLSDDRNFKSKFNVNEIIGGDSPDHNCFENTNNYDYYVNVNYTPISA